MENKELTIAICTYNRSSFLTKTIQALFTLDNIEKAEIIIVDNNSTDNTAKEVRRLIGELNYEVKYINEKRQGLSYARNTAIKASEL
ncbi:glycosyltransferase like 2 family protein (plasmid) [Bacillus cereus]|nr:glycosyltransferase like 2 family protein [Bacillus cereus]